METDYEKKEFEVLKRIVEAGDGGMNKNDLAKSLSMPADHLYAMLVDFENKRWTSQTWGEMGNVEALPAATTALHKWGTQKQHSVVNTVNVNGSNSGNISNQGQGNTQTVSITNNPDFDKAVKSLIELINDSDLHDLEKEERIIEIERIKQLAQKEQTPEVKQLGISKVKILETGLKVGELALKATPLVGVLIKFFAG